MPFCAINMSAMQSLGNYCTRLLAVRHHEAKPANDPQLITTRETMLNEATNMHNRSSLGYTMMYHIYSRVVQRLVVTSALTLVISFVYWRYKRATSLVSFDSHDMVLLLHSAYHKRSTFETGS